MPTTPDPRNLEQLLDRIEEAEGDHDPVSLGQMLESVGRRSFGPMLLLVGLVAVSPLSGIPGMPSTIGVLVMIVGGQLLLGRKHFWLPQWILRRSVSRSKLDKALRFLRPLARRIDRLLRERLVILTRWPATYVITLLCVLIAATMPPLEILPFVASTAGAALSAFGLALLARDGVLAIVAFLFTVATGAFAIYHVLN